MEMPTCPLRTSWPSCDGKKGACLSLMHDGMQLLTQPVQVALLGMSHVAAAAACVTVLQPRARHQHATFNCLGCLCADAVECCACMICLTHSWHLDSLSPLCFNCLGGACFTTFGDWLFVAVVAVFLLLVVWWLSFACGSDERSGQQLVCRVTCMQWAAIVLNQGGACVWCMYA